MTGWIITGAIVAFLVVGFILFLVIVARSFTSGVFDRVEEDRRQIEAIQEYNRRQEEKERRKRERRNR